MNLLEECVEDYLLEFWGRECSFEVVKRHNWAVGRFDYL